VKYYVKYLKKKRLYCCFPPGGSFGVYSVHRQAGDEGKGEAKQRTIPR